MDFKTRRETEEEARVKFLETVSVNNEGRYEAQLPFLSNHPPLLSNKSIAVRRLYSTVEKLKKEELYDVYNNILDSWRAEGVIETVRGEEEEAWGHYLPHRHVVKPNSTTPGRPVFDASAKERGSPSLNDCLKKGPNLIELAPAILLHFREGKLGMTADVRKAFLKIGIADKDRDFLRFLWLDSAGKIITFRHRRVVFGVTSSPFMLAAVICHHLNFILSSLDDPKSDNFSRFSRANIDKLKNSFYVDNMVCSVN